MPYGPQAGKRAGAAATTALAIEATVASTATHRHHGRMDEDDEISATRRAKVARRKAARQDRSAAALRENLKRRKEQVRARIGDALSEQDSAPDRDPA